MLCASAWVRRGITSAKFTEKDLNDEADDGEEPMDTGSNESDDDVVEVADVLADDFDGLRFHKSNHQDPFIENKEELYDEEEIDDLTVRDTDVPIAALRAGEDLSQLETYIYEDDLRSDDPNLYLHHETILPAFPLCVSWSPYHPTMGYSKGNLAAVGTFLKGIDIWDLNDVESLEPLVSLGGYQVRRDSKPRKKGKKGRKTSQQLAPDSHRGEVMSVDWNRVQQEYLASGGADCLVKFWDVESGTCVSTFEQHKDKVQALAWHPAEEAKLLSASFDKTAQVVDIRARSSAAVFPLSADAEKAVWCFGDGGAQDTFLATTEDGVVVQYDLRSAGKNPKPVWRVNAHQKAASACTMSQQVPGLLVTGSVDKTLKVWDIRGSKPKMLSTFSELKCGAIFDAHFCGDEVHPLLVSVCGSKGSLKVLDLGVLQEEAVFKTFEGSLSADVTARTRRRIEVAKAAKEAGAVDDDVEDDDEGEGSP